MDQLKNLVKNAKVMIGTPMYGGMCSMSYLHGVLDFMALSYKINLKFTMETLGNESLISRARNKVADKFMQSDCTHLMWIDADTAFKGSDILELLLLNKDVSTGLVCTKEIDWARVRAYINKNNIDNLSEEDLRTLSARFAFTGVKGKIDLKADSFEIKHAGNAFLMIKRKVFEDYKKSYPQLEYDEYKTNNLDPNEIPKKMFAYFDTGIEEETNHYLSEDYFFSQNVRKMGYKIWACPTLKLGHVGTYCFKGDIQALDRFANLASS
jgi:hypothetical protein